MPNAFGSDAAHILALGGRRSGSDRSSESQSGETMPFSRISQATLSNRHRLAWLVARSTWDATPTEIIEAYSGHVEQLHAIHGGKR